MMEIDNLGGIILAGFVVCGAIIGGIMILAAVISGAM
jgi:hypothetical protein